jgi:hypothetical protein
VVAGELNRSGNWFPRWRTKHEALSEFYNESVEFYTGSNPVSRTIFPSEVGISLVFPAKRWQIQFQKISRVLKICKKYLTSFSIEE